MVKQAIIIRAGEKPILCSSVVVFKNPEEFKKVEKECKDNLDQLLSLKDERIKEIEKSLKLACLEIDLLRGRISDEEYETEKEKLL